MRKILALILVFLVAGKSWATVTLTQGSPVRTTANSGSPTIALAYSVAVTAGNLLVAFLSGSNAESITSVSDSVNSGNWTLAVNQNQASQNAWIYYKTNTGAGTPNVTANLGGTHNGMQITIFEVHTDDGNNDLGLGNTAKNTGTTGVSDAGSINTQTSKAILIAGTEGSNGESTGGTGYTFLNSSNGSNFASCQFKIISSQGSNATAFATDNSGAWTAVAAEFGEGAGGAAAAVSAPRRLSFFMRR